jgi:hypothetical protein
MRALLFGCVWQVAVGVPGIRPLRLLEMQWIKKQ